MLRFVPALAMATSLAGLAVPTFAQDATVFSYMDRVHPIYATHGMVASAEGVASQVGLDILKKGGNAIDAGVAVALALAVTLPEAGNLGGGGFMMIHDAKTGETKAIDYREMAPAAATRDMYLDKDGNANSDLSQYNGLAVGVPGTVAGMQMALEKYGTMSLAEVLQPAIKLARDGIVVTTGLSDSLIDSQNELKMWPSTVKVFFKPDGTPIAAGEVLKQPELAHTLQLIADKGVDGFYKGETAEKIAAAVQAAGGNMTVEDLANYKPVLRDPVHGTYRGYEIVSMPPPSSGGVHIIQILNILEGYPIGFLGHNSAATIHLMAEAMKYAYADRSQYLGDSDFVHVPVKELISKEYAASIREQISRTAVRPSADIKPGDLAPYESNQTTHFSIVDKDGNAVSNTYTLNFPYGAGLVADGTGVFMNNEMDDFSAKPGVPNGYGLIGGDANAIQAGKRPLSSMSPTMVMKDGKVFLVTGSPGGARIITTVLQVIMNVIDHGMNIEEATIAPRIHHQWLPDTLRIEDGLSPDTTAILEGEGYKVSEQEVMGSAQSIMVDSAHGYLFGASDPRYVGAEAVGY